MPTNHEKYLAGEPLNEELRALREGRLPVIEIDSRQTPKSPPGGDFKGDVNRPLTQAERGALREMRQGPGWPVLQKLLERATMLHTEHATTLSQDDPLAKSDEIAKAWAYVKLQKQIHREINGLVEMELADPPEVAEQGLGTGD